jgi:hypothetical protein
MILKRTPPQSWDDAINPTNQCIFRYSAKLAIPHGTEYQVYAWVDEGWAELKSSSEVNGYAAGKVREVANKFLTVRALSQK